MDKIELTKMENLEGGSCASDSISLGLAVAGVVVCAATGPFGWGAAIAIMSGGVSFASLVSNGDCF